MMNEEEKFDELLKSALVEEELPSPPSTDYTAMVMQQVGLHNAYSARRRKQVVLSVLGFGSITVIAVFLVTAWKKGWLSLAAESVSNLLAPVLNILPFNLPPSAILLVVLHFILIRMLLAIYLLKRTQSSNKKYNLMA